MLEPNYFLTKPTAACGAWMSLTSATLRVTDIPRTMVALPQRRQYTEKSPTAWADETNDMQAVAYVDFPRGLEGLRETASGTRVGARVTFEKQQHLLTPPCVPLRSCECTRRLPPTGHHDRRACGSVG